MNPLTVLVGGVFKVCWKEILGENEVYFQSHIAPHHLAGFRHSTLCKWVLCICPEGYQQPTWMFPSHAVATPSEFLSFIICFVWGLTKSLSFIFASLIQGNFCIRCWKPPFCFMAITEFFSSLSLVWNEGRRNSLSLSTCGSFVMFFLPRMKQLMMGPFSCSASWLFLVLLSQSHKDSCCDQKILI